MKNPTNTRRLFCFGLGYCAQALATRLKTRGWTISGTCRSEEKRKRLLVEGIDAYHFDGSSMEDEAVQALEDATHVLVSIPPQDTGDVVLTHHARGLVESNSLNWLGYLSTTGVYGNRDGSWVDEQAVLRPESERARRRVWAEEKWMTLQRNSNIPVHIFRLVAIYGPGRGPLERVKQGKARRVDKPGQVFCRVHVEDVAQTLEASIVQPKPGAVYNISDDYPSSPAEVTEYACRLLGVIPPPMVPLEQADLSEMSRSFYADNKRVGNRRIKKELGVRLMYPDYKSGLKSLAK